MTAHSLGPTDNRTVTKCSRVCFKSTNARCHTFSTTAKRMACVHAERMHITRYFLQFWIQQILCSGMLERAAHFRSAKIQCNLHISGWFFSVSLWILSFIDSTKHFRLTSCACNCVPHNTRRWPVPMTWISFSLPILYRSAQRVCRFINNNWFRLIFEWKVESESENGQIENSQMSGAFHLDSVRSRSLG